MKTITLSQMFRQLLFRRPSETIFERVELEPITPPAPVEHDQPPPSLKYDESPPGHKVRWH